MRLATSMAVNLVGDNIDNMMGSASFQNTYYLQNKEVYQLKKFDLNLSENASGKIITLSSDFAEANVKGKFKLLELANSVRSLLTNYFPSLSDRAKGKSESSEVFDYTISFKKTDALTRVFFPELDITPGTEVSGSYNSDKKDFLLNGSSRKFSYSEKNLKDLKIVVETKNGKLIANGWCKKILFSDSLWADNVSISSSALNDTIKLNLKWENNGNEKYMGDVFALLTFIDKERMKFKILPSHIIVADSAWTISKNNEIEIDSTAIALHDFSFSNGNQLIKADGRISKNKEDQLTLLVSNFNMEAINVFTKRSGLKFKGMLNGTASISSVYDNALFSSSMDFKNLWIKDRKSTRLNSSHIQKSRMPSSA